MRRRRPEGGLTQRLPAWLVSSRRLDRQGSIPTPASSATSRPKGDAVPPPVLHAARARRGRTASSATTPSARAPRRQGPSLRSVRFAAVGLDAGSARATDGQLSDDASLRSRTTPDEITVGASGARTESGEQDIDRAGEHEQSPERATKTIRPVKTETVGRQIGGHVGWLITTVGSDEPADPMCTHRGWRGEAAPPLRSPRRLSRPTDAAGNMDRLAAGGPSRSPRAVAIMSPAGRRRATAARAKLLLPVPS